MPLAGQGILPSGAPFNELVAMTRRAFIPKVIVQLYKATPTLSALLSSAEMIGGGVSSITAPIQGAGMVTTQATDYAGGFTAPQVVTGLQNAEFNLRAIVTPIPFYVMEGLVQIDAAVIPILEARMNDAGNSMADYLSTNLWAASASAKDIWSLPELTDTVNPAAARGNFGGIDRITNTFWQGNKKAAGAVDPTRLLMLQYIASAVKSGDGEMPKFGVCGLGTWAKLAQDYVGNERYLVTPEGAYGDQEEVRAVFTALAVAGVPIYADAYAPEGEVYFLNPEYLGFKLHQDAAFAVAGPESLLPNFQLGYIMVLVTLLELVGTKPKAQTRVTGFNFLTL